MSRAEGGSGTSLVEGKNNSREAEPPETEQSELTDHMDLHDTGDGRYDCRVAYSNMEIEAEDGETANFRCGSWRCYCCAHRMRMNLIEALERLVERRPEMRRLLTLTFDDDELPDGVDGHEYLTKRFNALRTELNDHYGDLSYVWIRHEGDENGRPHIHLLVDRFIPQGELSEMAVRVGLGEVVDIRRVNARNAAKYLTAYLGKGALANLPKGLRRYGSSADIDLDVRGGDGDDREWRLMMDDHQITNPEGEPLRREVTPSDLYFQKEWEGPVPPD